MSEAGTNPTWYYRGREARGLGKPAMMPDGRLSPDSRRAWYAGWYDEDLLRSAKPSAEQVAEMNSFLAGLAAEVRTITKPLQESPPPVLKKADVFFDEFACFVGPDERA